MGTDEKQNEELLKMLAGKKKELEALHKSVMQAKEALDKYMEAQHTKECTLNGKPARMILLRDGSFIIKVNSIEEGKDFYNNGGNICI